VQERGKTIFHRCPVIGTGTSSVPLLPRLPYIVSVTCHI